MNSLKKTARLAGLLYVVWAITGVFGLLYVPSKIIVGGDAVATTNNMLTNEVLFRTYIVNGLVSAALWVFLLMVLSRLFKQVDERQVWLLGALVIVQIPAGFIMAAFDMTSLMLAKGEILKTFELNQRQDLAMLFLKINNYGTLTLELFWGLWLFPLGLLAFRSGFLPRFLGVWLIINGFAYVILSVAGWLTPELAESLKTIAFPAFFGEVAFMLWLLIMGARQKEVTQPER